MGGLKPALRCINARNDSVVKHVNTIAECVSTIRPLASSAGDVTYSAANSVAVCHPYSRRAKK